MVYLLSQAFSSFTVTINDTNCKINFAQLVSVYTRAFARTDPEDALYYLALVKYGLLPLIFAFMFSIFEK